MYKIVSEHNHAELWAIGFSKDNLQEMIDKGYFHKYMYEKDKHVKLIILPANEK